MALRYYANAPATSLASSCTALATLIEVASTTGLPVSFPYTLIIDRGLATEEAVEVTAASGTDLTVTRGADGTTAFAHTSGAEVVHGITARDVREPNAHVNATSGIHGVTGDVVGTDDTQTLTNKTLSSPVLDSPVLDGEVSGTAVDWQGWTPTWTSFTPGNATIVARYQLIGKTVHFRIRVLAGSTTTSSGSFGFTLPITPKSDGGSETVLAWSGRWTDTSASAAYPAHASYSSLLGYALVSRLLSDQMTSGAAVESGDSFFFSGTYEVA